MTRGASTMASSSVAPSFGMMFHTGSLVNCSATDDSFFCMLSKFVNGIYMILFLLLLVFIVFYVFYYRKFYYSLLFGKSGK
jgi:hypothetical protein